MAVGLCSVCRLRWEIRGGLLPAAAMEGDGGLRLRGRAWMRDFYSVAGRWLPQDPSLGREIFGLCRVYDCTQVAFVDLGLSQPLLLICIGDGVRT